jgi:hypothetical protein
MRSWNAAAVCDRAIIGFLPVLVAAIDLLLELSNMLTHPHSCIDRLGLLLRCCTPNIINVTQTTYRAAASVLLNASRPS